ncbi:FMN reductase [Ktedonobacter sp. SOSP1-52]|uniref:flavodoxin family protein n=1 Tax=Ktedonobacter sp. SOSP1-52 TaxID=2778366 RepID=UPI001915D824|nr:flavodoxin family protein [Ktedonobacter sp. SOSP1-52]GHO68144.1 FMN reductase [Ktedonobacter sp. SOSP1-52]
MIQICIVYHSQHSHTATQARAVAQGAASVEGVSVSIFNVEEVKRHWKDLHAADAIIFGCPTYMGTVSGPFKLFMDESLSVWSEQKWKNKVAAGFTNSVNYNGDKLNTLMQFVLFAAQHGMYWVGLDLKGGNTTSQGSIEDLNRLGSWIGAMAQSNFDQDAEHAPPSSDLQTAQHLGQRVALVTRQMVLGQSLLNKTFPNERITSSH